jgi:hypothetical protein
MSSITRVAVAVQVVAAPAHLAPAHQSQILPTIFVGTAWVVVAAVRCTCSLVWLALAASQAVVGGLFVAVGPVLLAGARASYRLSGCGGCRGD